MTTWHEPAQHSPTEGFSFAPAHAYTSSEVEDEADDGLSSCNSGDSVPDLSDMAQVETNVAGEQLYLAYRHAKRRWRSFTGGYKRLHFRRFRRGKGFKGRKGHKGGKGAGFGGKATGKGNKGIKGKRMFFLDDFGSLHPVDDQTGSEQSFVSEQVDDEQVVYLAGKGGKFKRKNPKGKDGRTLECSLCGSEDHLIKQCSKNTQGLSFTQHKQQNQKSFPSYAPSNSSGEMSQWSQAPWYFTAPVVPESPNPATEPLFDEPKCVIQIENNVVELTESEAVSESQASTARHYFMPQSTQRNPTLSQACSNQSALERQFAFAWFMPFFHTHVRGEGFEGLLIDVGAIGNLAGSEFMKRICSRATKYGQNCSHQKLQRPLTVEGVGKQSDETEAECTAPICLSDGRTGTFTTPVIPDSALPALLGLNTLRKERALIDCFNQQIIFIGAGGYRLQASPGSRTYELKTAKSGHLLLPCDCWDDARFKSHEKQLAF